MCLLSTQQGPIASAGAARCRMMVRVGNGRLAAYLRSCREMALQEIGVRVLERIKNRDGSAVQGGANAADEEPADRDGADAALTRDR